MIDVCLVTEGTWPVQTGGLSTWTHHVLRTLEDAEVAVISLGTCPTRGLAHPVPHNVIDLETVARIERLPDARRYIASGLSAARAVLALRPSESHRIAYVEHGDLVGELLACGATEGGKRVERQDRVREAARARRERREVTREVGMVVGVTSRTARRARREGAQSVRTIRNAVAPVEMPSATSQRLGFVGRLCPLKGFDRFAQLALASGAPALGRSFRADDGVPLPESNVAWELDHPDPWTTGAPSVLAMPSRMEASPFAALEAEARGIRTLVSDVADIEPSELIERLPWDLATWVARSRERLNDGTAPKLGAKLAANRWNTFRAAWRNAVENDWS